MSTGTCTFQQNDQHLNTSTPNPSFTFSLFRIFMYESEDAQDYMVWGPEVRFQDLKCRQTKAMLLVWEFKVSRKCKACSWKGACSSSV
jgi:hypothetical protein